MKNILSSVRSFLCLALCLFGVTAYAQESVILDGNSITVADLQTVNAEVKEKVAYSGDSAFFDVSKITAALGIENITDAKQYVVNMTTNECVEDIYGEKQPDGWHTAEGDLSEWGASDRMVCVKIQEPESGMIDYIAAIDKGWLAGESFTAMWAFVANEKAALVKIVVNFVVDPDAIPEVELPNPETVIANLEIVGRASLTVEREYTQGYNTTSFSLVVKDLAEKLGMDNTSLGYVFNEMIYVNTKNEGIATGILSTLGLTDGWLGRVLTEDGDETEEVCSEYFSNNPDIFVKEMKYDSEETTVSFVLGQMPNKFDEGQSRNANLYVVYGQKAYIIHLVVNFIAPSYNGLEEMTKVGGETVSVSQAPNNDYGYVTFTLDLEAIAELLGAENTRDVQMHGLGADGGLSNDHTANNGGWWLTSAGTVTGWGSSSAFFIEPEVAETWDVFHVGQYPNAATGGEEFEAKLYLTFNGNYYEVIVKFTIGNKVPAINPEAVITVVGTRTYTINQELNAGYIWSDDCAVVPNELLEELIGTTTPYLFGETAGLTPDDDGFYSDNYTITEKPGFWLSPNGNPTGWNNNSPWGLTTIINPLSEGFTFRCMHFPGIVSVGDSFTGNFYLANSETGDMLQVVIIYNIVDKMETVELVGETDLLLMVCEDDFEADIDMEAIATALGFESIDEMESVECMRALNANGVYDRAQNAGDGVTLDVNGYYVSGDDEEEAESVAIGIYSNGGKLSTYLISSVPEDLKVNTKICFENEGKRYVINATIVSESVYTNIDSISATASSSKVFDLLGREVQKVQKGIFIQNGKKVVVK